MTELEAARQRIATLEEELAVMARQLTALTRYVFGRRSEQTPPPVPGQPELNLETETETEGPPAALPAPPDKPKGGSRKGRKVRAQLLPEHLPVEETVIINPLAAADPDNWREIDRKVSERLERIPGKLVILRVVRPVFVRKDQPFAAPVSASAPPQFLPGSFFGPQLMVDLTLGKYLYHLPLYRQAKALEWESGVKTSPATLCQTLARIATEVEPVVQAMADDLWRAPCVQFDLTPVRCLSREHAGGSFLGQMWVAAVPGGDVLYTWDPSKAASVAEGIIPPWFKGILQTDGGPEILCFLKGGKGRLKPPPGIRRAACWAHVRRKFFEGAKAGCPLCARLLKIINVLYRIESHARDLGLTPQERTLLRQRRARRVVAGLRRRIDRTLAAERPKSAVGQACTYTLGQWDGLKLYLDHGVVAIDNNSVENAIRPCALGKKNWLFVGDVKAGPRCAIFYSLIGSCLRRGLNPRAYLHWLFTRIAAEGTHAPHTLTPAAYAAITKPEPIPAQAA
jgi:transposase